MKEVISLNIGQCGVQISNSCWELFCLEHNMQPDGQLYSLVKTDSSDETTNIDTFFSEKNSGKYVARSISIDLEPSVIDQVRTGAYRNLFHPDQLISGKEDAASNFARGERTVGTEIVDTVVDRIRKVAENCCSFQGFTIFHSINGGTGSGFTSLLLKKLMDDYQKKTKIAFCVYPSPRISTSVVESYNAVLSTHCLLQYIDVVNVLNNESLYDIFDKQLNIESPVYQNLNRVIAQTVSSLTASLRFGGALNTDLNEIVTNLVPYSNQHFLISSYAPLISAESTYFRSPTVNKITESAFEADYMLAKFYPSQDKYYACTMMYRGDVVPKEVNAAIARIKNRRDIRFVDWAPTGFKTSINFQAPLMFPGQDLAQVSRSAYMIANTAGVQQIFWRIDHKFDLLFSRRAFVHWFVGEGLEEGDFCDAREELAALEKDYEEIEPCYEGEYDGDFEYNGHD